MIVMGSLLLPMILLGVVALSLTNASVAAAIALPDGILGVIALFCCTIFVLLFIPRSRVAWLWTLIAIQLPWGFCAVLLTMDATLGLAKRPLHDFLWDGLIAVPATAALVVGVLDICVRIRRSRSITSGLLSLLAVVLALMVITYVIFAWIYDDVIHVNTPFDFI
jgi:hypothetical protein